MAAIATAKCRRYENKRNTTPLRGKKQKSQKQKNNTRDSNVVPHLVLSNLARRCLTSLEQTGSGAVTVVPLLKKIIKIASSSNDSKAPKSEVAKMSGAMIIL